MKKTVFYTLFCAIAALMMTACTEENNTYITNNTTIGNCEQYNDEFTILNADWQWDDVHYNWYYTFGDYTIMDRALTEYSSVTAYEVRRTDMGDRFMRALPYSQTWWDDAAQSYYTLELGYDYGFNWITFNFTDSAHDINIRPGDITIRVCVQYVRNKR